MAKQLDFLRRTAVIAAGRSAVTSGQMALSILLVRIVSEQTWASLALLLTIYGTATHIGGLNLNQGIFFFFGRLEAAKRRLLALQTAALLLACGVIVALVLLGLTPILEGSYYSLGFTELALLAVVVLVELPAHGAPQLLVSIERPGLASAYGAFFGLGSAVGLGTVFWFGGTIAQALLVLLALNLVRLAVYFVIVAWGLPPGTLKPDFPLLKEQLIFTLPLSAASLTHILNRYIDKWFVAGMLPEDFGVYALAANEFPFLSLLPYAAGTVLATRIVHAFKHEERDRARLYWHASAGRVGLLVVPGTLFVVAAAPELITVMYTGNYDAAAAPFRIYTLVTLIRVVEYGLVLRACGDTPSLLKLSIIHLAANAILTGPLILIFGMEGAALSTLLASLIGFAYVLQRIGVAFGTTVRDTFPWSVFARLILAGCIAAAVCLATTWSLALEAWQLLTLRGLIYLPVVLFALRLTRVREHTAAMPEERADFVEDMSRGAKS